MSDACTNIDKEDCKKLYLLLNKYELLFHGTLAVWNMDPVDIVLE